MQKYFHLFFIVIVMVSCSKPDRRLDTKLIASKYSKGIVKVILFDATLEKEKPGKGYIGRGSGFFVTDDGYIFTNRHVVEYCVKGYIKYDYYDASKKIRTSTSTYSDELIKKKDFIKAHYVGHTIPVIQVYYGNGENDYKLYEAKVISIGDGAFDGALLKIVKDIDGNLVHEKFTALPLGDSNDVKQGEQLCVFGYPQQIGGSINIMLKDMSTLSLGIMSGFDFVFNSDYGYMKTDAEIHPGNSGGPVFNEDNKVVGIATSKGVATGIGLIGGINGMYYISAIESYAHEKLINNGLQLPNRSFSINAIKGEKQYVKTLKDINYANTQLSKLDNTSLDHYKNSKFFFSNISPKENNNQLPPVSKQYTSFSIDRNLGGKIWLYVDNYPSVINTNQVFLIIDKLDSNGVYTKYKDKVFDIDGTYSNSYFSYFFTEHGKYRISLYSKEMKFINTKNIELSYR